MSVCLCLSKVGVLYHFVAILCFGVAGGFLTFLRQYVSPNDVFFLAVYLAMRPFVVSTAATCYIK